MDVSPAPCDCPATGWCARHLKHKGAHLHKLCQTSDAYRAAWDKDAERLKQKLTTPAVDKSVEPGLLTMGATLATDFQKWTAAGAPVRPDASVNQIFYEKCVPCENFVVLSPTMGRCKKCGCYLGDATVVQNKLKMATASCPLPEPKWTDEPGTMTASLLFRGRGGGSFGAAGEPLKGCGGCEKPAEEKPAVVAAETIRPLTTVDGATHVSKKQPEPAAEQAKPIDPLEFFDRHLQPTSLRDLWTGCAAFMVCGGPSLNKLPLEKLKDRGIVSLGINNVAAHAHVRAMVFSDPPSKFHHGVWFDPTIMKLCPVPKLRRKNDEHRIRAKLDGRFVTTGYYPADCPNVFGFTRMESMEPETFLTSIGAYWGVNRKYHEQTGRPRILFTFFLGLRLLHYLGVRRIYLLGADFKMSLAPGQGYAFAQGRDAGAVSSNQDHYRLANLYCQQLRPVFERSGLEVYNCNPESGLLTWDYVPFEQAYKDCRGLVPDEPFDTRHWYEKRNAGGKKDMSVPDGVDPDEWLASHP